METMAGAYSHIVSSCPITGRMEASKIPTEAATLRIGVNRLLGYLSSPVTSAKSSGSAVVYLICSIANEELTLVNAILAISFL